MINLRSDKAIRIVEYLKKELQIPDSVIRFSVHFDKESEISVDCSYFPQDCNHHYMETTDMSDEKHTFVCVKCGHQYTGAGVVGK